MLIDVELDIVEIKARISVNNLKLKFDTIKWLKTFQTSLTSWNLLVVSLWMRADLPVLESPMMITVQSGLLAIFIIVYAQIWIEINFIFVLKCQLQLLSDTTSERIFLSFYLISHFKRLGTLEYSLETNVTSQQRSKRRPNDAQTTQKWRYTHASLELPCNCCCWLQLFWRKMMSRRVNRCSVDWVSPVRLVGEVRPVSFCERF